MTTGLRLSERTRHDLTDARWAILELLLRKGTKSGRPPKWTKRQLIDGTRWRTRVGAPWRDVPTCYGPWQTVYGLFRRWQRDGTWRAILTGLQARADAAGLLTCDVSVDTTIARAHQHAAGATDVLWTPLRPHSRMPLLKRPPATR
jgi:transposase